MPQLISVEISAEQIADAMHDDGSFALEVWRVLAERCEMGALKDDAADLVSGMSRAEARHVSSAFIQLGEAMRDGYNHATAGDQI